MEMTTMGRASLNIRMRMGMGQGVKEHSCKNGDRLGESSTCRKEWGSLMDTTLIDVMWSKQAP